VAKRTGQEIIAHLQDTIYSVLSPLVPLSWQFAYVYLPDHINAGDSAIWLGSLRYFLKVKNTRPAFVCATENPLRDDLERALPEGPIFLHGGGNFGDLWPVFQENRERILELYPDRKIIQLPQTVYFDKPEAVRKAAAVIKGHPDFTLLVRDRRSLEFALDAFSCEVRLCPDMAFVLGPLARPKEPSGPLLLLLRDDRERMEPTRCELPAGTVTADWRDEDEPGLRRVSRRRAVMKLVTECGLGAMNRFRRRELRYRMLAEARLAHGLRLLSSGRFVITDRLHGHILCMLLGTPHIALDTQQGKLSGLVESWTRDCQLAGHAMNLGAAIDSYHQWNATGEM
jgi:pyruvyl transferase EpsO